MDLASVTVSLVGTANSFSLSVSFMFRVQPRAYAGFLLEILLDVCTGDIWCSIPPNIKDRSEMVVSVSSSKEEKK